MTNSSFTVASGGATGGSPTQTGSGNSYTVTVPSVVGTGALGLTVVATGIVDLASNALTNVTPGSNQTYTVDTTAPTVQSITRVSASPTSSTSVQFSVVFSESVSGVTNSSFSSSTSGVTTGSPTQTGSSTTYTVTVASVSGSGTLGLSFATTGIVDQAGNALSSTTPSTNQSYTITGPVPNLYLAGGTTTDITAITYSAGSGQVPFAPSAVVATGLTNCQEFTATLTNRPDGSSEQLGVGTPGTLSSTWNNVSGTLTLTGTATVAVYQTAIQSVYYINSNATPIAGSRIVECTITDSAGGVSSVALADIPVNAAAAALKVALSGIISAPNTTLSYTELSGAVAVAPSSVIANTTPGVDQSNHYFVYYDENSGYFYYSYEPYIDSIKVEVSNPTSAGIFEPGSAETLTFTPRQGYPYYSGYGAYEYYDYNTGDFGFYSTIGQYYNGGFPIDMTSLTSPTRGIFDFDLADANDGVVINCLQNSDQLSYSTLSLSPLPFPNSDAENILRTLSYNNTSSNPSRFGFARKVTVTVRRAGFTDTVSSVDIAIVPTNHVPVVAVPMSAYVVDENDAQNVHTIPLNGLSIADSDANGGIESLTLSVNSGILNFTPSTIPAGLTVSGSGSATLILSGTLDGSTGILANALANGNITYTPTVLYNGSDTLTLSLNDNGHASVSFASPLIGTNSIAITVNPTNQPPAMAVPSTQSAIENASLTITQPVTLSDPDLISTDVVQVSLSAGHGVLTLASTTNLDFSYSDAPFADPVGDGTQDATMTFRGTITDVTTALAQITYLGDLNYYGSDAVTVSINDLGQTDPWNGTPEDAVVTHGPVDSWVTTRAFAINVAFVNHVPAIAANNVLVVPAGDVRTLIGGDYLLPTYPLIGAPLNANQTAVSPSGAGTTPKPSNASHLVATDIETIAEGGLTYTVILAPAQGELRKNSVPMAASSTFTQAQLNAGIISYHHNGAITGNDSFVFTCSDDNDFSHPTGATDVLRGVNSDLTTNIFTIQIDRTQPTITPTSAIAIFAETPGVPVHVTDAGTTIYNQAAPTAFVVGGVGSGTLTVSLSIPTTVTLPAGYPAFTDSQDTLGINPPLGGAIAATLISSPGVEPKVYSVSYTTSGTISLGTVTIAVGGKVLTANLASASDIPVDAVTALLRTVSFSNPSHNPSIARRNATVSVTNGAGLSSLPATLLLDVSPSNESPTITAPVVPAGYTVPRVTISGSVGAVDADSIMTYQVATQPGKGTVTVTNNVWTYTAFAGSSGRDSFVLSVGDLGIASNIGLASTPATQVYEVEISAVGDVATPLFTSNAPMEIEASGNLTYAPTVSTSANLKFQLIGLTTSPTLQFNDQDGTLTWIGVPSSTTGYYDFGIMVTDTVSGLSSYQPILLKVFAAGSSSN